MAYDDGVKKDHEPAAYTPPPKRTWWQSLKYFLWDPETKECMGRSFKSWLGITAFYTVFFAALAAFFAAMLMIFYQTLDYNKPKWLLDNSCVGKNPGLGYRPMSDIQVYDSTLIWFDRQKTNSWSVWSERLKNFLNGYQQHGPSIVKCDYGRPPENDQVCFVDVTQNVGNCTKIENYGYHKGQPCIALKLNKLYDWNPIPYTKDSLSSEEMPDSLRKTIKEYSKQNETLIWITCEGENDADKENIGKINYWPQQGFPTYYYPFTNTPGYLSPVVLVEFLNPTKGLLINIECKAWAENIAHLRASRKGSVHFELLVD